MKKREKIITALLVLCLIVVGSAEAYARLVHRERVRGTVVTVEDAGDYSEREIRAAVRVVEDTFRRRFPGKLLTVRYDAAESAREEQDCAAKYGAKHAIVLSSDFMTDADGHPESQGFDRDRLYQGWKWVLVRNGGTWRLMDWGVA